MNFPFTCSNIPAYIVYFSQLIRYSRACGFYQNFLNRGLLLTTKLLSQWLLLVKLKSTHRKYYGATMIWLTIIEYTWRNDHRYVPLIVNTSRSFPHSWPITGYLAKLTSGAGTAYISPEHLNSPPVSCYSIFSVMCMFCRSWFFLLYFFFRSCFLFFDMRILITRLVFLNSPAII